MNVNLRTKGLLIIIVSLMASCTRRNQDPNDALILCSAFCYYRTPNGFARDAIHVTMADRNAAWNNLTKKCEAQGVKDGPHELQKSLSTVENPGDNFITATQENSCGVFPGTKRKSGRGLEIFEDTQTYDS